MKISSFTPKCDKIKITCLLRKPGLNVEHLITLSYFICPSNFFIPAENKMSIFYEFSSEIFPRSGWTINTPLYPEYLI